MIENTFAEACYEQNTIEELTDALLTGPDSVDCKTWGLTGEEWQDQVKLALSCLQQEALNEIND